MGGVGEATEGGNICKGKRECEQHQGGGGRAQGHVRISVLSENLGRMGVPYQIGVLEVCYFSCGGFFGIQALMEHLR